MKKIIIILLCIVLMSIGVYAGTITRNVPATASPGQQFTVTYTANNPTEYFVSWRDNVGGGCTPSLYENFLSATAGGTKTDSQTFTAPQSGSCTFSGIYNFAGSPEGTFPIATITIGGGSQTCSGSGTQSCMVNYGGIECEGTQTRSCSNGAWGSWSECVKNNPNCNGGSQTCSGAYSQSCSVGDCAGTQSRTCNNGVFSDWSSCVKNDANCGSTTPPTTSFEFGKCMMGNATTLNFGESIGNFECFRFSHLLIIIIIVFIFLLVKK